MVTIDANIWVAGFDATDVFHDRSSTFLREVTRRRLPLHGPTSVLVEVGCVLARRFRSQAAGLQAASGVAAHQLVRLSPLDEALLVLALQLGSRQFLRAADALYAATAQLGGSQLVSWDRELIQRAGALTPTDWLAANP